MSYATADALKQRLPPDALNELAGEKGEEQTDVDARIDAILAEVDGLIDTAANTAGLVTPIVSVVGATNSWLETHELSIAKYLLLDRRGMTAYDPAAENLYNKAIAALESLAKGNVELAGAPSRASGGPVPQGATGSVVAGSESRVFGRGSSSWDSRRGI